VTASLESRAGFAPYPPRIHPLIAEAQTFNAAAAWALHLGPGSAPETGDSVPIPREEDATRVAGFGDVAGVREAAGLGIDSEMHDGPADVVGDVGVPSGQIEREIARAVALARAVPDGPEPPRLLVDREDGDGIVEPVGDVQESAARSDQNAGGVVLGVLVVVIGQGNRLARGTSLLPSSPAWHLARRRCAHARRGNKLRPVPALASEDTLPSSPTVRSGGHPRSPAAT
jgi:hypothetical protein